MLATQTSTYAVTISNKTFYTSKEVHSLKLPINRNKITNKLMNTRTDRETSSSVDLTLLPCTSKYSQEETRKKNLEFIDRFFEKTLNVINSSFDKQEKILKRIVFNTATLNPIYKPTSFHNFNHNFKILNKQKFRQFSKQLNKRKENQSLRLMQTKFNQTNNDLVETKKETNESFELIVIDDEEDDEKISLNNKCESLLPIIPILSLKCETRSFGTAVVLTWDVELLDKTENYSKHLSNIKEYELISYKENETNESNKSTQPIWSIIGKVEPLTPPVKCTLTDFLIGCTYHFAVRIRDKQDRVSEYSKTATAKL